ncbi:MAG: hypothetical protein WBG32_06140 [Nodosilinea sp.]
MPVDRGLNTLPLLLMILQQTEISVRSRDRGRVEIESNPVLPL